MVEALDNFNTSIEAYKLVKDPTKLFILLYSKYGDIIEDYQSSLINQIIYKCSTHLNIQYQEIRYDNMFLEFLRRFYKKKEVKERVPNLYEYYKNYHLFYLKPILRNFHFVKLLHNYQDKKAEIFYKNNYSKSSNDKTNTEENSATSSLSSSDHYTDYRIIFNTKVKNLLEGKKESNTSVSIELSKIKKDEKNETSENDLRIKTKILEESTLNDIMKELKTETNKLKENENENNNTKETNISSKYKKKSDKKIKNNQKNSRKKNNSPKVYSKSPTFQMNHQIHIIKQGSNTNNNTNNNIHNIKSNIINQQMYILSQKNSYSNKRNNSHKNKHFSPKMSYYIHNIASKFEEMFKKYPNYFNSMKHRKNKTGNNSNNNTIKKSVNLNNIYGVNNSNFQSNYKKFSKLSASLKNSKFNITYFSQINSNNNSRNSMSAKKSNKLQKNKKIINEINQFNVKTKKPKHKKNKTFDFNTAKGRYIELKKNYTNYNLLRFKPSYSNANKTKNKNPILFNLNIMKSPKNNFGLKNNKDSNEKSGKNPKNKRFINRKNKIFTNNKKSFVSIASCSSPKFSFIMNKNEPLVKESLNAKNNIINNNNLNNNNNNIEGNLYSFLNNNNKNISKIKKNKYRKNNISYTNNNFNINFNNIFFGSSRPTSGPHNNIISDNVNTNANLQINKNININNNYSINNINNLSNSNSISLNTKKHATLIHQNNILSCKNSNINNNYNNNVSNLYIKSLNNLYNFSRNKNNKISNCSHTQTQSQSIAKNSKVIRISDSKVPVNKTNSFILRCENNNKNVEDKNINLNNINNNMNQKKVGRAKMMNQIEDLIMKTKKHIKFGSEHQNKISAVISNKPTFNNCNNKSKNQTKNKSNYHEMFIKNLKRTSSTSIKVNTKSISSNSNNNQAVNVVYKK